MAPIYLWAYFKCMCGNVKIINLNQVLLCGINITAI